MNCLNFIIFLKIKYLIIKKLNMNNSVHFNTTETSANVLVKNMHEVSYLQRLNKIEKRENRYFNNEYNEFKTTLRNRKDNFINGNFFKK